MTRQEAEKLAIEHVNYLKNMNPMGFSFKQAEQAVERFTNSYMSRK